MRTRGASGWIGERKAACRPTPRTASVTEEGMRAIIDLDLCTGCGLCTDTCPSVYELDGDVARVRVGEIACDDIECAKQGADECPFEAIAIEE
jgi:ferredoxin